MSRRRSASRANEIDAPLGALLEALSIDHRKVHGWQSITCCFHDENVPSLRVNIEEGGFFCQACGASGGTPAGFLMALENIDFSTAKRRLLDLLGVDLFAEEDARRVPTRSRAGRRGYVPKYKRNRKELSQ